MATVLVLGVKVPFTSGGQEVLVKNLVQALRVLGHRADLVELPYDVHTRLDLLKQIKLWQSINFTSFAGFKVDRIICTKFPSYFANHPNKTVWLVHQHRPLYDLYGTQFSDFSDDPRSEAIRRELMRADFAALRSASVLTSISTNVANRLREFNDLKANTVYPPLPCGDSYYYDSDQPFILSVGRICRIKRLDLLIKALPRINTQIKLKIVGQSDDQEFFDYILNEIKKHHLSDRVEFLGRVSDEEVLKLFATCFSVYYAPYDEDYGFVSLEALASKKAVLTTFDSGGVLEFIDQMETGIVVDPTIEAISDGFNQLFDDQNLRIKLGTNGYNKLVCSSVLKGWESTINTLLAN